MEVLQPVWNYHNKVFHDSGGDGVNVQKAVIAANIFNPQYLQGEDEFEIQNELHPLANELKHFGYEVFNDDFITC